MDYGDFDRILHSLEAKALNLGDRSVAYPKYGQAVILAGGAGSGKGFVLKNVLSIQGRVFDPDELKKKVPLIADEDAKRLFEERYGYRITDTDLAKPWHVENLHYLIKDMGYEKRIYEAFFKANMSSKYKPNVIFDTTLKNMKKARSIAEWLDFGGYEDYNRHVVWILNSVETAIEQNAERARKVPVNILLNTHEGASLTIRDLIKANSREYFDGDVWIVFNRLTDTIVETRPQRQSILSAKKKSVTTELKKYTAFQLKQMGRDWMPIQQIETQVINKLNEYVPEGTEW